MYIVVKYLLVSPLHSYLYQVEHKHVVGLAFCFVVDRMFNRCNFSNDSDCSYLFDGIPVYITALQALLAALLIMTSVPVNILLITSMIVYREMLDTSIILAISFLISNISVSVFLSGEIFLTSVARAWLFDYWGCQLIAFLTLYGTCLRWIIVGFLSLDRFCRVFYPFSYPRHDKKVIITLLVVSIVVSSVVPVASYFVNATGFDITLPGCLLANGSVTTEALVIIAVSFVICVPFGGILPTVLYTLMYIKGRRLRNVGYPNQEVPNSEKSDILMKYNKAALTYFLMMLSFHGVSVVSLVRSVLKFVLPINASLSRAGAVVIFYALISLFNFYVIGDLVILLSNRDQRKVFVKLLKKLCDSAQLWKLRVF